MSFDTLTVIVLVNVVVTIALWLESTRRPPQPKLKKKFVEQLLHSEPITPKHQPPKTIGGEFESLVSQEDRLFFGDFADFANVVNWWLANEHVRSRWRLQELPETEVTLHGVFDSGPTFGRSYAVFYNQVRVGELEVEPFTFRTDHPRVITHIHLDYPRLLPFDTIRDFFVTIACRVCYDSLDSKEYFQAQQAIDRAMTEALWRSNQVDVYNFRLPDTGEINLRLDGIASGYLERRETLRNQATSTAQADEELTKKKIIRAIGKSEQRPGPSGPLHHSRKELSAGARRGRASFAKREPRPSVRLGAAMT
jgi:hypothetical protein